MNIRFRLKRDAIPTLHQVIGPNYIKLIGPSIASQMREVIAQYTAEQVYSTGRQEIQDKIRELTIERLGSKMMQREGEVGEDEVSYNVAMRDTFILYDTLLYGIELPTLVVNAINRKTEQYYISEEYKFRVEREKRESERKKIEAEGIREFQTIVSQGISDSYLRWRGIEATLQLSQSTNAKVVVIGTGKDGLPIILGNADVSPPPQSGGTSATDGVTTPQDKAQEKTMTPPAAKPLEKMPGAGLPTPMEKTSAAGEASATPPKESRWLWPVTRQDIERFFARLLGPTQSNVVTEGPSAQSAR
jgi:hypothetical protein